MRFAGCVVALVAALTLFVGGATGRGLATTTTVRVEVQGVGEIRDDKSQLDCGNGNDGVPRLLHGDGLRDVHRRHRARGLGRSRTGAATAHRIRATITLDMADADHEIDRELRRHRLPARPVDTHRDERPATRPATAETSPARTSTATRATTGLHDRRRHGLDAHDRRHSRLGLRLLRLERLLHGHGTRVHADDDASKTASATFKKPRLTVTINGNGTVTGAGIACTSGSGTGCAADVDAGTDVTLTATAPSGGSFTGWGGACTGTSTTCTVTMSADRAVTANFSGGSVAPTTFPLTVSVNGSGEVTGGGIACGAGGTTCSANLTAGTSVTLTATPSAGATFTIVGRCLQRDEHHLLPDDECSQIRERELLRRLDRRPSSSPSPSPGTASSPAAGSAAATARPTCLAKVKQGSTIGLTATPGRGATFIGWSGRLQRQDARPARCR